MKIKKIVQGLVVLAAMIGLPTALTHITKAYELDYSNQTMYFSGHTMTGWSAPPGVFALNPIYFANEFPDGTIEPGAYQSSGNVMPNKAGALAQPNDSSDTGGAGGAAGFTALGLANVGGTGMRNDPDRKQKLFDFLQTKNQTGTEWERMGSAFIVYSMIQRAPVGGPWVGAPLTVSTADWQELEDRFLNNPNITMTYDPSYPIIDVPNSNGVQYYDGTDHHYDIIDNFIREDTIGESPVQAGWVFRDASAGNAIVLAMEVNCANVMGGFAGFSDFDPVDPIDLELTKVVDGNDDGTFAKSEMIQADVPFSYRVTLQNVSGEQATGVVVEDVIPAGVSLLGVTPSQGTATPTTGLAPVVAWNVGTVNAGASHTLLLRVVVQEGNLAAWRAGLISGISRNLAQVTAANEPDIDSTPDNMDDPYNPGSREDEEDHADTSMLASLGDYVWIDYDNDGRQGINEPGLNGVEVSLIYEGSVIETTTTQTHEGRDGYYIFEGLEPNTPTPYTVHFEQPTGYLPSPDNAAGVPDGEDSDADPVTGVSTPVTLTSGEHNPTIDAGFTPLLTLGDVVWSDGNDNGIFDADEDVLPNVPVYLYEDTDGNGVLDINVDTLINSMVTNSDGEYFFGDLTPGDYFVYIPSEVIEEGGILEQCTPSSVFFGDPNNDVDSDNNGSLQGEFIMPASAITLAFGDEPAGGGSHNPTVDFGFHCIIPEAPNTGVQTTTPSLLTPIISIIGAGVIAGGLTFRARLLKK